MAVEHQAPSAFPALKSAIDIVPVFLIMPQISLLVQFTAAHNILFLHGIHGSFGAHGVKQADHIILPLLLKPSVNPVSQVMSIDGHQLFKYFYILVSVLEKNLFQIPHAQAS